MGMFGGPEVSYYQTYSAKDWLSILRTPYQTQNLQKKHRTDSQMTTKARKRTMSTGLMKICVWNVRGLYGKEKLLQEELKKSKCRYSGDTRNKKEIKGIARVGRLYFIVQWCPN